MNTATGATTLKGTSIYEQRYLDAFSQRTVRAAALVTSAYVLLQATLAMVAGRSDWLSISFLVSSIFDSIPWLFLLLVRLRRLPLSGTSSESTTSSPNTGPTLLLRFLITLLPLSVWVYCCWSSVKHYAGTYASSLLLYYTYPEGKYGPPLIREQPFYLHSYALWYGLSSYWLLAPTGLGLRYSIDGRPPGILELTLRRIRSLGPRLGRATAWAAGILCLENLFGAPLTLLTYISLVGALHPLRRPMHPIGGQLLSLPLWWHLAWASLGASCLLLVCDLAIEYCFGRCFHLCRGVPNSNVVLIGGLRSSRPMVRQQALLELRHLLLNEPFWRESLYREFIGEEALSRIIGRIFVEHLRHFADHLGHLNADLRIFSANFEAAALSGSANDRLNGVSENSPSTARLFTSTTDKGTVAKFIDRITGTRATGPSSSVTSAMGGSVQDSGSSKLLPDVLEIARRPEQREKPQPMVVVGTDQKPGVPRNKYLQLALFLLRPFAGTGQGQAYAALLCEHIKAHWGLAASGEEEALLWLLQALCALITTSYDEDVHGQVQFALNDLLGALLAVWSALDTFAAWPRFQGQPLGRSWLGGAPLPTERRASHLLGAIEGVLEMISVKFADSLDQLKLEVGIRERLARVLA